MGHYDSCYEQQERLDRFCAERPNLSRLHAEALYYGLEWPPKPESLPEPLKCKKHPRYQAKRKPRVACEDCWRMWFENKEGE